MNEKIIGTVSSESELVGELKDESLNIIVEIQSSGPIGPPGENGLTVSVNDISQVDGNIYICQDDIPSGMINKTFSMIEQDKLKSLFYVHDQIFATDTWIIEHNLGRYPVAFVVDSGNSVVVGDMTYVTNNKLIISFTVEFAGKAYLT